MLLDNKEIEQLKIQLKDLIDITDLMAGLIHEKIPCECKSENLCRACQLIARYNTYIIQH